jgi:glycosyltransferase 2 family protein
MDVSPCRIPVACDVEDNQLIRNARAVGARRNDAAGSDVPEWYSLSIRGRAQGGQLSIRPRDILAAFRNRFSWNWIGFALSATIVGISIYVLTHLLRDIDLARVAANVRAMPGSRIGWAVLFIGGAYATLTCYDLFALRTIGAYHVPYRIAAMASFTSYAIGHNIGATAFSGGAIRYRIYSQFALGVVDVTKICFLTGLTFWLGNLAVLGFGMVYRPEGPSHILQLPPETVRVIGAAALVFLFVYVAWASMRPRAIGVKKLSIVLPGGLSTLIQIGIGLADLGCSSLAMYSLMPSVGGEDFFTISAAFVSATLLGFASHAPGSLGVFDAAMLVALPEIPKEDVVAGLLVFRALYFMTPFCLALITMAIWETTLFFRRRSSSEVTGQVVVEASEDEDKADAAEAEAANKITSARNR